MKDNYSILEILGEPEVLAQLAEEAAELAQAALKLRRALEGQNPTPKTEEECRAALLEEVADVELCLGELGCMEDDLTAAEIRIIERKRRRWIERLANHAQITPSVDAVPVVRCRDCVSYGVDALGNNGCNCPEGLAFPEDDSYCCFGLRRKENTDRG